MQLKYRAIVLKTVKYGDSKIIVDLLTREMGRTAVLAKNNSRNRGDRSYSCNSSYSSYRNSGANGFSRQIFQPLTLLDIECDQRNKTSMPLLKGAQIVSPYLSLHADVVKMSVVFFIAEFLSQVSRAEQSDELFFDFVENCLKWYDVADNATANFHLMFLVRASRFLGFYPNMETYKDGYFFNLKSAEFEPSMPLHRDALRPDDARKVMLLMRMSPDNMHLYRFSREERNRAIEIMLRFYMLHIPGFRDMKSWDVLKEIFI